MPIFNAICSICELEPSILDAICIQLFGVGISPFACYLLHFRAGIFLFTCYLQQFWSWNLAYRTPVATFGSWNLRFWMILRMEEILHQLETISNYETLFLRDKPSTIWCRIFSIHNICIYVQHFGPGIFHPVCYLQAVVGCWLLSVSCGFVFVLLFLLHL